MDIHTINRHKNKNNIFQERNNENDINTQKDNLNSIILNEKTTQFRPVSCESETKNLISESANKDSEKSLQQSSNTDESKSKSRLQVELELGFKEVAIEKENINKHQENLNIKDKMQTNSVEFDSEKIEPINDLISQENNALHSNNFDKLSELNTNKVSNEKMIKETHMLNSDSDSDSNKISEGTENLDNNIENPAYIKHDNINKGKKKKQFYILESDSEEEIVASNNKTDKDKDLEGSIENLSDLKNKESNKKNKERPAKILESDSDEATSASNKILEENNVPNKHIIQSDSDDETIEQHGKSGAGALNQQKGEAAIYSFNEKGDLIKEKKINEENFNLDSSESDGENSVNSSINCYSSKEPTEDDVKKPTTGKEAMEQRREIQSESQRMTRETQVSLPYHVPKSHTLKEFLQKRPKFAAYVPNSLAKAPPSVAIKMTREQLEIVTKKMQEREQKLIEFYKSDTDSGDEIENCETSEELQQSIDTVLNDNSKEEESVLSKLYDIEEPSKEIIETNSAENDNNLKESYSTIPIKETEFESKDEQRETSVSNEETPSNLHVLLFDRNKKNEEDGNIAFDFNLDDMDVDEDEGIENVDNEAKCNELDVADNQKLEKLLVKFNGENEKFMSNAMIDTALNEEPKNLSKRELLKEKLASSIPKLHGGPDEIIDLDSGLAEPSEVSKLKERFFKQISKKGHIRNKVELSVQSVIRGEVHNETVGMSLEPEEIIDETPGAKFKKLREELQNQIAQRRSEQWLQKHNPLEKSANDEKTSECEVDDEILDDEEEETELTESDFSDEENENEFRKESNKTSFADNEAKEDDGAEADIEDEENDDEFEDEIGDNLDTETENQLLQDSDKFKSPEKRKMKRILKAFEDSDDESVMEVDDLVGNDIASNDTVTDADDYILPPNQPRNDGTPLKQTTQTNSELGFLTPINHLTALENMNSDSKFLHESPNSFSLPSEPSPLKNMDTQISPNKFFNDYELSESQTNIEDLEDICSGKFPSQSQSTVESSQLLGEQATTQDLLNVCSGKFTGLTQLEKEELSKNTRNSPIEKDENIRLDSTNSETHVIYVGTQNEIKSFNDDDMECKLITQLLDEEELEKFKKKFDSPITSNTQENEDLLVSINGTRIIFDSSDDETEVIKKSKQQKKVIISDDDESDKDVIDDKIDLDNMNEDEINEEDKEVEYDSEENEVEPGAVRTKMKVSDFVENEAELSESEWGSADEDEQDLDKFEIELGDEEKFDENKVRNDLEKIHMRQLLDDDNREVKFLQELLLEDGELHGAGRQRQFRWKNIDNIGNEEDDKKHDDDAEFGYEDECEGQWRKMRLERETFLKKSQENSQEIEETSIFISTSSQVLKLGEKTIVKNKVSSNTEINDKQAISNPKEPPTSSNIKQPFTLIHKRGSFLSRNEKVLQKLAEITKSASEPVIGGAKNSKKFIFQTVQRIENANDKKRKAQDGTPVAIKRLRLSNLSPATNKKIDKNLNDTKIQQLVV